MQKDVIEGKITLENFLLACLNNNYNKTTFQLILIQMLILLIILDY